MDPPTDTCPEQALHLTHLATMCRSNGRAGQLAGVKRAQPEVHAASRLHGPDKAARNGGYHSASRHQGKSTLLPPQLRGRLVVPAMGTCVRYV